VVQFGGYAWCFVAGVAEIPTSCTTEERVDATGAVREFFAVTLQGLRQRGAQSPSSPPPPPPPTPPNPPPPPPTPPPPMMTEDQRLRQIRQSLNTK